jgi:hypothetical protein
MFHTKTTATALTYIIVLIIFGSGIYIQQHLILNWDVNWLLKCAQSILQGGKYYHNFCDPNPPLILYLYMPIVFLHNLCNISLKIATQIYTFTLAIISFCLAEFFLNKIFSTQHYPLLIMLAFTFVILPFSNFAQREHVTLLLITPYLIMATCRAKQQQVNWITALFVGLMAGFGFAIKPYFLLIFATIELYLLWKRLSIQSLLRTEIIVIISIIIGYIATLFFIHSNYLFKILPLVLNYYLSSCNFPLTTLISAKNFIFCIIVSIWYLAWHNNAKESKPLHEILLLAMLGFLCIYLLQAKIWFYHLYPATALGSCLLISLCREKLSYILSILIFIIFPASTAYFGTKNAIQTHNWCQTAAITKYFKKHNRQKVFIFTTEASFSYGLIDQYTQADIIGRFSCFWFLPSMLQQDKIQPMTKNKKKLIEIIAADLKTHHPDLILVDSRRYKPYLWDYDFNYFQYFSKSANIKYTIKQYQYITTINNYKIYHRKTT